MPPVRSFSSSALSRSLAALVISLLLAWIGATGQASAQHQDDPGQLFLGAFMRLQNAEKLEANGDLFEAYGEYRRATLIYDQIANQHPTWKPNVISHRRVSIRRKMNEIANTMDQNEQDNFQRNLANAAAPGAENQRPAAANQNAVPSTTGVRPPTNNRRQAASQRGEMEANLRQRIQTLEKMVVDSTREKSSMQAVIAKSRDARKLAEYELNEKKKELADMQSKLAAAEESKINQSLESQRKLTAAEQAVEKVEARYKKQLADLQTQVARLEGQLTESRERETQTAAKVTDLTTKLAEANQVITTLRGEVASITRERDELVVLLKTSNQDAVNKATALRKQELEQELKQALDEIASLKKNAATNDEVSQKEIQRLRTQVASLEKDLQSVRDENVAFKSEIDSLRKRLALTETQLAEAAPSLDNDALIEENKTLRQIVRNQLQAQAWRTRTKRLIQSELARLEIGSRSLMRLLDRMEGKDVVTPAQLEKINDPYIQAAGRRSGLSGAYFGGAEAGSQLNDPDAQAALDESMQSPEMALADSYFREQVESMSHSAAQDFSKGKFDSAARTYQLIVEAEPTDVRMRCNLGVCLLKNGDFAQSAEQFEEAIGMDDTDPFPYYMLALAQWKLGEHKHSAASLTRSLELDPSQHSAFNLLGVVAMEQELYADSDRAFTRAIKLRNTYAEAHRNLAVLLSKPGYADPVRSLEHYREALKHGAPRNETLEDFLRYNDVAL